MELQEKMKVAKALRAYAESKGYSGKRGARPAGEQKFTSIDCSHLFDIPLVHIKSLLALNESIIDKIPLKYIEKTTEMFKIFEMTTLPDKYVPKETLDGIDKQIKDDNDPFLRDLPSDDPDDANAPTVEDMLLRPDMFKSQSPEMPSEMHVSNRLYSVEGKCKEIVDYMKQYKLHWKAVLESLRILRPLSEDTLLEADPWFLEYEITLIRIIHHIDTVIDKLENL